MIFENLIKKTSRSLFKFEFKKYTETLAQKFMCKHIDRKLLISTLCPLLRILFFVHTLLFSILPGQTLSLIPIAQKRSLLYNSNTVDRRDCTYRDFSILRIYK